MIDTNVKHRKNGIIHKNLLFISRHLLFVVTVVILTCIHACTPPIENNPQKTHTFVDDYGRTVDIPQTSKRIVSLSPAVTEIIYALQCEHLLVGRTDYCNHPLECKEIRSIGGINNLNIEAVAALSPDLVISGSMVTKKNITQLENMGIAVVCIREKKTFDGLYKNISQIGELLNCQETADSINNTISEQIKEFEHQDTNSIRPTMYYVVGYGNTGNFTAGGNTFINDIIQLAGGRNIASHISGWSFSTEALMNIDPDYIIIRKEDMDNFRKTHPYSQLSAVKKGHLISIESNIMDLQIPRNIEAIKTLRDFVSENPLE